MPHYNLPLNQSPNAQLKYYKFGINIITQIGPSTSKPPNHRPNQTNPNKPTPTNKPLRNKPPLSSLPNTNQSRHKTKPNTPKQNQNKRRHNFSLRWCSTRKRQPNLWILRDHTTQTVLLAKNLDTADKDNIASLLKEIKN